MNIFLRTFFWLVLAFAIYHLARDIMQMAGIENALTNIFHWRHVWCGAYCNYVSLPFELAAIAGAAIVLRRNRAGLIGVLTLCVPPVMFFATVFLP
ncbi:MAG TPA: hypothetical protein VI957_02690 [Candidatus Paceibacterota bacterium]